MNPQIEESVRQRQESGNDKKTGYRWSVIVEIDEHRDVRKKRQKEITGKENESVVLNALLRHHLIRKISEDAEHPLSVILHSGLELSVP